MAGTSKRCITSVADSRPNKIQKLEIFEELGEPANLGTSLSNPIIVDDDDDDEYLGWEASFERRNFAFSDITEVDIFGNPIFNPSMTLTDLESDGFVELITSPTYLFYHDTGRGAETPAFRSLPIVANDQASGKARQSELLALSSGWPRLKDDRVVNVYLEGEYFRDSKFDRHCHLHICHNGAPDLDTLQLSDVRRELARILGIEDPFTLQIEVQHAKAHAKANIFSRGLCKRFNAAWDDTTIDDRSSLRKALPSSDAWLRVRTCDYIIIEITTKDISCAITPSDSTTIHQVRQLIASIADTAVGAIHMYTSDVELVDNMDRLDSFDFTCGSRIKAVIETRECVNCYDDVGYADFPLESTTEECLHELNICKSCISTWITTCLNNGNWNHITCLSANCGAVLQYGDIKRAATDTDMQRYERFSMRDALSEIPGFRWCLSPTCDAGQIHENSEGTEQILTCIACGFKRCTACDREWHQDETCKQYSDSLAVQPSEINASEAWIVNNSRKCPGCQSPIQKVNGCDHMTCTRCLRQFCWICMADYRDIHRNGNAGHAQDCRYYSAAPARRRRPRARRAAAIPQPVNNAAPQPISHVDRSIPAMEVEQQVQAESNNNIGGFVPHVVPDVLAERPAPTAFVTQMNHAAHHSSIQFFQTPALQHLQELHNVTTPQFIYNAPISVGQDQVNRNIFNGVLITHYQEPRENGLFRQYNPEFNNILQHNLDFAQYQYTLGDHPAYQS
ncbi:hypothetical protein, variant 1 [Verruconis gallopava]|uniref:RBR-type E3 ubiquitin transferase n=1 Tax=Verruconis gallopava TaxID=253628 RepID=A0A0D2BAM9_9PEZI|nr:hypothetical protein, variant 1 [Verruconis gallopava]KIW08379.1 hypothetical protein, variant 1 [Verruconis gallopava]